MLRTAMVCTSVAIRGERGSYNAVANAGGDAAECSNPG